MRVFLLALLVISLATACKDETETQGQLTAKKIQAEIASRPASISSIWVLTMLDDTPIFVGQSYSITSDGFIVISSGASESATFNLADLKGYRVTTESLTLYY